MQSKHDLVARKLTEILLNSETTLYHEHVKGSNDIIAYYLSRELHIPCKKHSILLTELFPSQTPMGLSIAKDLLIEIIYWLKLLKGGKLNSKESPQAPMPSKMMTLVSGSASWSAVASSIRFWKDITTRPSLNEHGKRKLDKLSGKTIRKTIHSVCSNFRTNLYCSPLLEVNEKASLLIKRQIDVYTTEDSPTKPQKCLPPLVFKKLYNNKFNELSTAIGIAK